MVSNLAPSSFVLQDPVAQLQLPSGLSLAPTAAPQSLTTSLPDIPGGSSASTDWIIRGDTEGYYNLTADVGADLEPIGVPIQLQAQTQTPLHVWGCSALALTVDVDDQATTAIPTSQPLGPERFRHPVVQPHPPRGSPGAGSTKSRDRPRTLPRRLQSSNRGTRSPPKFRVVSEITGTLDLSDSFIQWVAGNSSSPTTIMSQPATPISSVPTFTATVGSDGLDLSWQPVAGATGYEIFGTPTRDTLFGYTPLVSLPATATTATLPSSTSGFLAVSTIDASGANEMYHPLLAVPDLGAPTVARTSSSEHSGRFGRTQLERTHRWGGPITGYTVVPSPACANCTGLTTDGTTTTVVGGLTPGIAYTFTVAVSDTAGPAGPSAPANEVVPVNVPPGPGQGPPTNPWDQPSAPVDAGTMEVTATASADSSVEGSGTPQFTVAPYASDPIATNNTEASFFDLYVRREPWSRRFS